MRDHLEGIVKAAVPLIKKEKALVLDIGCNDGTLLRSYPAGYEKFGVDPSNVGQGIGGDIRVVQDVFPSVQLTAMLNGRKFDIITSIAMFYDLESPVDFTRAIRDALAADGVWIFEMSYMPTMLEMNSYDTICHEHLEYYSLAVVENILSRAGLKLFRAELNAINGGSIRCFASHAGHFAHIRTEWNEALRIFRLKEFDLELDTDKPYRNFQERINIHKDQLVRLLTDLKKKGKKIHIYGASTKGNTILQWCGIDSRLIDCAADRNPDKDGAMTLGTNIPIISEEKSRAMKPDYYLVLPWHFREEFVEREADILRSGSKFIFPLPEIEILGG
ncbi:MAG: class I SAM-dependent methyltransferase [Nitrospirota bacterium]